MEVLKILYRSILQGRTSRKFAWAVVGSISFSMAIILGSLGIMDGFDTAIKVGLKHSTGDLLFYKRTGFVKFEEELPDFLKKENVLAPVIQTEGFFVFKGQSKGVRVRGITSEYKELSLWKKVPQENEIFIGTELSKQMGVTVGDDVTLALAMGNERIEGMPLLHRFKIGEIVHHGIYLKDLRSVYLPLKQLQELQGLMGKANLILLKSKKNLKIEEIKEQRGKIWEKLGADYVVKAYWQEYGPLLEAVKVEKVSLGLLLQLVVIMSVFNMMAFLIFLREKKAQEIFLVLALGASRKIVAKAMVLLVVSLWFVSCIGALLFSSFFDWCLSNLSFFELPSDVYHLERLSLHLSPESVLFVFLLALFWVLLIVGIGIYRMNRKSLLFGLRREFV